MRNFTGNRKEQRDIMEHSYSLRVEDIDMDIYCNTNELVKNYKYTLQIFVGKTAKPMVFNRYVSEERRDAAIEERISVLRSRLEQKELSKLRKKERNAELKKSLVPGSTVRTSFSYNMTFNHFYKIISSNRSIYKLEVLGTEWVDGDRGWTGNVKAGSGTGNIVQGKLTASGLKIDNLYGNVINPSNTFYENHMD